MSQPILPSLHRIAPLMERVNILLAPALEEAGGTHTERDLWEGILLGAYKLWVGSQSAVITEVLDYPGRRVLHVWLAGGELEELRDRILPDIETWAREQECDRISLCGRKGWSRALPDYGERWRYLTKELTYE